MNTPRPFFTWQKQLACGVLLLAITAAGIGTAQESKTPTQASMRGIFVTVSGAYTYSLDPDAFSAPENREKILLMLESLAKSAQKLDTHGAGLDPSFEYLKRSLARDANDALSRFKTGNYVGSRFVLGKITENCVTCHTRLPERERFDLGAKFVETGGVRSLNPFARATLETATRQFDRAMATYEEILASPDMKPRDLALFGVFESYFKIAIGALNNTARPLRTMREFVKRPELPGSLREDVQKWISELEGLKLDIPAGDVLESAQMMMDRAIKETSSRSDRSQLVEFVAVITLLHRFMNTEPQVDEDVARAYFLLGVAESYVADSYWISEVDFLMDRAIRRAPRSDVARKALAFLEDYTQSAYRITPARAVPDDLEVNLKELRELVNGSK